MIRTTQKNAFQRTFAGLSQWALALCLLYLAVPAIEAQVVGGVCNVPFYGYVANPGEGLLEDHFFTTSAAFPTDFERFGVPDGGPFGLDQLVGFGIGYVSLIPMEDTSGGLSNTTPLFHVRIDNGTQRDSLLTTDPARAAYFRDVLGYDDLDPTLESVWHVLDRTSPLPLYRLYNAAKMDHAYTTNETQKNALMEADYELQGIEGSLILGSPKFEMTDARTIACHGARVTNPGDERTRDYFQGAPLSGDDTQTFSFDLFTGDYFSKAASDHLVVLTWGDTGIPMGVPPAGRGIVVGRAQGLLGICFEYFNGPNDPITGDTVGRCMRPNGDEQALPDDRLFHFEVVTTADTIRYVVTDQDGVEVAADMESRPSNPVPSGRTDIFAGPTNDDCRGQGPETDCLNSTEPSFLEIRNAMVTIDRQTASIGASIGPASQDVFPGDTAYFTVTISNTGSIGLTSVVVEDPQAPDCDNSFPTLAPGQNAVYNCSRSNVEASFTNIVQASANSAEGSVSGSGSAAVTVLPVPSPDLEAVVVQSTLNPVGQIGGGGPPVIRASVRNVGDVTATNVQLRFHARSTAVSGGSATVHKGVPAGCVLAPPPPGSSSFEETYLCDVLNLDPNETFTLIWEDLCVGTGPATGQRPGLIFEASFLSADQDDPNPSNDQTQLGYYEEGCTQ